MSDQPSVFERTVSTLQAALENAYYEGVKGRFVPQRSDAIRLTWQLVTIASHEIQDQAK